MKKKGAIQMSMQTIIVVVIGVTLLTLGLKFVYDTFSGIGGQQEKVSKLTEKQITELYGESEDPIYLPRDYLELKQGKTDSIDIILRNVDPGSATAGLVLNVDTENIPGGTAESVKNWFTYRKGAEEMDEGEASSYKIAIKIPNNAKLGTYLVTWQGKCSGGETASSVCEGSADLIIEVKA